MKKLLMILAIVFVVGFIASIFVSQSLDANLQKPKDPHSHYGNKTVCYNQEVRACGEP